MTTSDYAQSAKSAATTAATKVMEAAKQAAAKVNLPFDIPNVDLSKVDLANIDVNAMAATARDKVETVAKDVSASVSQKITLVREAIGI